MDKALQVDITGYDATMKMYKLLDADRKIYKSETPGEFGGNSNPKIYGRLDCPSALSTIKRFPGSYEKIRVFFADEKQIPYPVMPSKDVLEYKGCFVILSRKKMNRRSSHSA